MGKTADFHQDIWSDPWFVALAPDAKLLYVWGFTNQHGNMAGLFTTARPLIEMETGVRGRRLDTALAAVEPKLLYHQPTGALWVVGRAKRVRSKTVQIATSIANAVKDCPHPPFALHFLEKYEGHAWLRSALREVRKSLTENAAVEPTVPTLNRGSGEVPSQGQSQGQSLLASETEPPPVSPASGGEAHERLEQVKERLKGELASGDFERWVAPLEPQQMLDGAMVVKAPSDTALWVRDRYTDVLAKAAGCPVRVAESEAEREERLRQERKVARLARRSA